MHIFFEPLPRNSKKSTLYVRETFTELEGKPLQQSALAMVSRAGSMSSMLGNGSAKGLRKFFIAKTVMLGC